MTKLVRLLLLLTFITFHTSASDLPDKLLNLPFPLISGETTSLSEFKGKKPIYLKFWATWCQPCMKEMPHFADIQHKYGKSVQVISINIGVNDNLASVQKTIAEFGLTMPTVIDSKGDLAQAFRFIGTPYHLLFDKEMNLIHRGHQANESLDNKIALVSQAQEVDLLDMNALEENEEPLVLPLNDGKTHALFFTATWCDWYLKDTRPNYAKNCIDAQKSINNLVKEYANIQWHGIVSRLWTAEKDLSDYQKRYKIEHDVTIDKSNGLFHRYSVQNMPTLLLIKNNKVILRTTDFSDITLIKTSLKALTSS